MEHLLPLFDRWTHSISYSQLSVLLANAWQESPYNTLILLFHIRDCHGIGPGYRDMFYQGVQWFIEHHPEQIRGNLHLIPQFGYWKDLLVVWELARDELLRAAIVYLYCQQLREDYRRMQKGQCITLAGKWAPTERCAADREYGFVKLFCEQLGWSRKLYRQRISKLRKALNVTERLMSDKSWGELDFDDIPAKSRRNLHNALKEYCGRRYERWCARQGSRTLLRGYELAAALIQPTTTPTRSDSLWREWEQQFTAGQFGKTLCVCDVSPSMKSWSGTGAIDIAAALTLLISSKCASQFQNKVLTFSRHPQLVDIAGDTPSECAKKLLNISWSFHTDLDTICQTLQDCNRMPEQLFIFSNNLQLTRFKISPERTQRPGMIYYWNIIPRQRYCTFDLQHHEQGIIIINGFSQQVFDTITRTNRVYPHIILQKILEHDDYSQIKLI